MRIVMLIVGVLGVLVGVIIVSTGDRSGFIVVALGALLLVGFFVKTRGASKTKARKAVEDRRETEYLAKQFELLEQGTLPELSDTPIILAEDETAHLSLPASRNITKNKVVGHAGRSGGVSIRVAKGVSVRTGSGRSRAIYQDVTKTYPGRLVLTNQRLIFVGPSNGFECKVKDISACIVDQEDQADIQVKSKNYSVLVAGAKELKQALGMIG